MDLGSLIVRLNFECYHLIPSKMASSSYLASPSHRHFSPARQCLRRLQVVEWF